MARKKKRHVTFHGGTEESITGKVAIQLSTDDGMAQPEEVLRCTQ